MKHGAQHRLEGRLALLPEGAGPGGRQSRGTHPVRPGGIPGVGSGRNSRPVPLPAPEDHRACPAPALEEASQVWLPGWGGCPFSSNTRALQESARGQAAELCLSERKGAEEGSSHGEEEEGVVAGCPLLPTTLCRPLSCSLDPGRSDSLLFVNVESPYLPPPGPVASTPESLSTFCLCDLGQVT